MKFTIASILFIICLACNQNHSNQSLSPAEITINAKTIHPKFREWNSPDGGQTVRYNPPVLLWPLSEEGNYEVRLSQEAEFNGEVISAVKLPYAMYNPHRKLATGKWYWQVRSNSGAWSDPAVFAIGPESKAFVTPEVDDFLNLIPRQRPRVLAWRHDLEDFQAESQDQPVARDIVREAQQYLNEPLLQESDARPQQKGRNARETRKLTIDASRPVCTKVHQVVTTLAQAYLLTANEIYARAGIKWIEAVAHWDPEGVTKVSDFSDSQLLNAMAVGYDSFNHLLTANQKNVLLIAIAARGAHFYDKWVNFLEAKMLSNHVWQHILEQFFQVALAVKDDLPVADDWLGFIYEIWQARTPIIGHKDGAWSNGISYFRMNTLTMLSITSYLKDITGLDFRQDEFYRNNPEWMIYAWPPGEVADGFANDAYKLGHPDYPRNTYDPVFSAYAELNARITGNPYAAWYVDRRREVLGLEPTDDQSLRWFFLQKDFRQSRPNPPASFNLPQSRLFPEVGVVYMNSDLGNAAHNLRLAFKSSPYGSYSHTHAEHNCFNLFYGGQPLFSNTGYRPANGDPHYLADFKHTRGHNGILIDDLGQPYGSEAYGWIPRFLNGDQLSYAVGDATNAYSATDDGDVKEGENPNRNHLDAGLKKFRRHILMLRPQTVVIYDELETEQPAKFTFMLQNRDALVLDQKKQVLGWNHYGRATAKLFASTDLKHTLTDQFAVSPENWRGKIDEDGDLIEYKNHWHYHAFNREKQSAIRFLTIIRIDAEQNGLKVLPLQVNGNQFEVGDWLIEAQLDASQPARLKATRKDGTVYFTSVGELDAEGKNYQGQHPGSSKLLERIDGKLEFQDAVDQLPESMKKVMVRNPR